MQAFIQLLNSPAISVSGLEELSGLPARTLHLFKQGKKPLPVKHIPAIALALTRAGILLNGWEFREDEGAYYATKNIPGTQESRMIIKGEKYPVPEDPDEIPAEDGFVYYIQQSRNALDAHDLVQFFKAL